MSHRRRSLAGGWNGSKRDWRGCCLLNKWRLLRCRRGGATFLTLNRFSLCIPASRRGLLDSSGLFSSNDTSNKVMMK